MPTSEVRVTLTTALWLHLLHPCLQAGLRFTEGSRDWRVPRGPAIYDHMREAVQFLEGFLFLSFLFFLVFVYYSFLLQSITIIS